MQVSTRLFCGCVSFSIIPERVDFGRGLSSGLLDVSYRLYMSETMSISASAAAIFCSDDGWGRPPKRKDMIAVVRFCVGWKMSCV